MFRTIIAGVAVAAIAAGAHAQTPQTGERDTDRVGPAGGNALEAQPLVIAQVDTDEDTIETLDDDESTIEETDTDRLQPEAEGDAEASVSVPGTGTTGGADADLDEDENTIDTPGDVQETVDETDTDRIEVEDGEAD